MRIFIQIALIIGISIFQSSVLLSQQPDCYVKYDFDEFLSTKTIDKESYLSSVYKYLKYPQTDRANNNEGVIKLLFINHHSKEFEIFALNQIGELNDAAKESIRQANASFLRKTDEKYIAEIVFEFDLKPFKVHKDESTDIRLLGLDGIECGPQNINVTPRMNESFHQKIMKSMEEKKSKD